MLEHSPEVVRLIDAALAEDYAFADPTTGLLVPESLLGRGILKAKSPGVLAGVNVALSVFRRLDPSLSVEALARDGDPLRPGQSLGAVEGRVHSILRAERTALNFVQRMSGIATATRRYVDAVQGTRATIVDTRKTAPGMRALDKYAVRCGGGKNHRQHLADGVLVKDNHLDAARARRQTVRDAVALAVRNAPHTLKVEVEVTDLEELREALDGGAHVVLLDNMDVEAMRQAVKIVGGRVPLEASGGVTLENVRQVAETGVDLISIGALTHSVVALDISLDVKLE